MSIKRKLIKLMKKFISREQNKNKNTVVKSQELTLEGKEMLETGKKTNKENIPSISKTTKDNVIISLDEKINNYIRWYCQNIEKENIEDLRNSKYATELRNFIEKMAVWYELRYPDYEINRLLHCSGQEEIKISDVMFNNNNYINNVLDENSEVRILDWNKFYNTDAFIKSLPWEERYRFQKEKYSSLVYLDPNYTLHSPMEMKMKEAHLHLTSSGFVIESEYVDIYSNYKITNKELKGMHVKKVLELFKERGIQLPSDNELEKTIKNEENWLKQKEELLDAVMYRIIDRGGSRIGPRRGFLFAKEFKRNIDIPMMYAIEKSDPGLRLFINEYLKSGGSENLICYVNYFNKDNKKLGKVSIKNLLLSQPNNAATFYTDEETKLHQRLVNAISSQIDPNEVKKEKVKKLRLQRKLENSKNNNH